MAEFGPPGVKSTRAWVEHDQCGMGNPPGVLARLGATRATVAAYPGIGNTPTCGVRAPKGRYGLQHLAQKGEEVGVWLTVV